MTTTAFLTKAIWHDALRDHLANVPGDRLIGPRVVALSFRIGGEHEAPHVAEHEIALAVRHWKLTINQVIEFADVLAEAGWLTKVEPGKYNIRLPQQPSAPEQPPVPAATNQRPCALYRWHDDRLNLLYVGITHDIKQRSAGHARKSCWWVFATRQDIEWFPNRAAAEAAERSAIKNERPIFNRQHNDTPTARQKIADYLSVKDRMDLFVAAMTAP